MPQLLARGLYGIAGPTSDGPFARRRGETLALAQAFAAAGAPVVQVRDKAATGRELVALACELRALLPTSTLLVVNDRLDVALASGADGVHLGQDDLPLAEARHVLDRCGRRLLVGLSTHDPA
jgi:thiamine-phosphate pyrophosphorylase